MAPRRLPRLLRALIRWFLPGAAAVTTLFLVAWDYRLTDSPHVGWIPESTSVAVYSDDLPGLWRDWENSDLREVIREAEGDPLWDAVMDLRKRTGVRWRPHRVRAWFGRSVLALRNNDGDWAVCIRPGVLYRAASRTGSSAERILGELLPGDGPLVSGKREGFVIAARDASLLDEMLTVTETVPLPRGERPTITISLLGEQSKRVIIAMSDSVNFLGSVDGDSGETGKTDRLQFVSRPDAMLTISGDNLSQWVERLRGYELHSPLLNEYAEVLREVDRSLPLGWADTPAPFLLVLEDVDVEGTRPLPAVAWVVDGAPAFEVELPPQASAYEWGTALGWLVPLQSDRLHAGFADNGTVHFFSTSEPLMRRVASMEIVRKEDESPGISIDADGALLAERIEAALYRAADQELLAERNRDDIASTWSKFFESFAFTDTVTVEVKAYAKGWMFGGSLAPKMETEAAP